MDKTKIEWCDSTWNPVTGCNHNCEYCYARRIAERFEPHGERVPSELCAEWDIASEKQPGVRILNKPVIGKAKDGTTQVYAYPYGFKPTFYRYLLDRPFRWTKPRTIFVCSMADLFGAWVPDSWIEEIFAACEKAPQHRYLFLTKNPKRYCDLEDADKLPIKENMWYGTSVTNGAQMEQAADAFGELPGKAKTFFSIEPILEDIAASSGWTFANNGSYANWIILGAETGRRKEKVVPEREWIEKITEDCDEGGIPLFMKDSLIPIIGEDNMRRELPRELRGVSV